jgi:prepilin-type N-terminal cleavage/methylation domain-containing protein
MNASSIRTTTPGEGERGFGLIEIVVAMFLLAILAMAFLPVLVQGMKVSASNTTIAAAAQLVSQNIEDARTRGASCASLEAFAAEPMTPVVDGRGVSIVAHRQPVTCPAAAANYPTSIDVTVYVTKTGQTDQLASAVTRVFVSSRS